MQDSTDLDLSLCRLEFVPGESLPNTHAQLRNIFSCQTGGFACARTVI
jgi:hypothetical protein